MQYKETPLKGCYVIHTTPFVDHRGAFARFFCEKELAQVILSQLTATGSEASAPPLTGQATLPSLQHDSSTSALLEVCRAALTRP